MNIDLSLRNYWESRKDFAYYREVQRMVEKHCPDAESIIDVGAGPILIMNDYKIKKRTVLDAHDWDIYQELQSDINKVIGFFLYAKVECHDVVLCLEVLEHAGHGKKIFADKLFKIANKLVVVSLPYKWKTKDSHHNIDESTLSEWIPDKSPIEISIVQDNEHKFMIATYKKG